MRKAFWKVLRNCQVQVHRKTLFWKMSKIKDCFVFTLKPWLATHAREHNTLFTVSIHRKSLIQACTPCIPRQDKTWYIFTRVHITSNPRMHFHLDPVSHVSVSICYPGYFQAKHQSLCLPKCSPGYLKARLIPNWCYPWSNRAEEKQLVWEIHCF